MDKIKYRAISYRPVIKAELQTIMEISKKINQYQRRPMESLKNKLKALGQ